MGLHRRPLVLYKLQYNIPGVTKQLIFQKARIILDVQLVIEQDLFGGGTNVSRS